MRARTSWLALLPVPFTWALSTSLLIPVLPRMRAALGVGPVEASLLLTALSLPAALALPVAGFLSDRVGRRPVLLGGLVLYGLGGLAAGLLAAGGAPFAWLVAARALQGLSAAATHIIALSMVADRSRGEERLRAVSLMEAANSAGKLAAPLLGSAAALLAWYAPFFVYPAVAWPVAAAVMLRARETLPRPVPRQEYARRLRWLWRALGGRLLAAYAAGLVALAVWFGLLLVYAEHLERAALGRGLARGALVSLPVAVLTLTSGLTGRLGGRTLPRALAAGGMAIAAAAAALPLLGLEGPFSHTVPVSLLAVGLGVALPGLDAVVTSSVHGGARGLVTTLFGAVRALGGAAGPPLFTAVAHAGGPMAPWLAAAGLAAAAAAASLLGPRGDAPGDAGAGGRAARAGEP